jgi:hypothetical protein
VLPFAVDPIIVSAPGIGRHAGRVGVAGMRRRRLAAYDSAVSSSLPPPNVTVVRRADQAAFKSLLLDTCATPRHHPLAVPA